MVLVIIGVVGMVGSLGAKPTDQQVDLWLQEDIDMVKTRALEKTGVDSSELVGDEAVITGLRLVNLGGAEFRYKKGADQVVRYTPVEVVVVNFGQNQVLAYTCVLDLFTGKTLNESTSEYFYKDVVSVQTQTISHSWSKAELPPAIRSRLGKESTLQLNSSESFVLTTAGGTTLQVMLDDAGLVKRLKLGDGKLPKTTSEKAIQTIRKMLREKKG
jgi:hypothetical protein